MDPGRKMKVGLVILPFVFGLFAFAIWERSKSTKSNLSPRIGLEIGEKAPAFILTDQFGREQSKETLKGSNGTVLLFFRSADW
jgi:cytochrome oxidase Cu insertion factor (SCO1/SenC/PrrC family)